MLRNAGPLGGPGFPEWGMLPIPKALLEAGPSRHAADFRRPHVRHLLRRLRPARGPRMLRRRPAGAAQDRRHRAPRHSRTAGSTCWSTTSELARAAGRLGRPEAARSSAATAGCSPRHVAQADKGCDFDFLERGLRPGGRRAGHLLRARLHPSSRRGSCLDASRIKRKGGRRSALTPHVFSMTFLP